MKTLYFLLVVLILCSCNKQIDVEVPAKKLSFDGFATMLTKDKTYIVSEYYKGIQQLAVPDINKEDTYTFDRSSNDGWISSKEPCIEYHYNFKVFTSGESIVLEWLDFSISPETFIVSDYKTDEWFVLKQGDIYTRYEVKK